MGLWFDNIEGVLIDKVIYLSLYSSQARRETFTASYDEKTEIIVHRGGWDIDRKYDHEVRHRSNGSMWTGSTTFNRKGGNIRDTRKRAFIKHGIWGCIPSRAH